MKIGLFTYPYQRNSLEDAFIDAKRFGYDYIELWGGRPHAFAVDLRHGELDTIKRLINKYEMPILCYTPEHNAYPYNYMIGSESQRQDAIEYLKLCLDMSKAIGAKYMLISAGHAGYSTSREEIWNRLISTVKELTSYAESIQQTLILEALTPMESNVCTTADDLAEVFQDVDSDYLAGMCDVVPPFIQHESIITYFEKLGSKMRHLHIVDSDGTTDAHVVPGEGIMPMKELLLEIKERGYGGSATIELVSGYINEPRLYTRQAIENFKAMIK